MANGYVRPIEGDELLAALAARGGACVGQAGMYRAKAHGGNWVDSWWEMTAAVIRTDWPAMPFL